MGRVKLLKKIGHLLQAVPDWVKVSVLFSLTFVTTTASGSLQRGSYPFDSWADFSQGLLFSGPLLFILMSHEMGHYLMCRRHGVAVTPPFFIPLPPYFFIGTLGAFIRIKQVIPNRKVLVEIAAAGPLAGMVAALPMFVVGILTSPLSNIDPQATNIIYEGKPLLTKIIMSLLYSSAGQDMDISLNAVAFAGWLGFLVTLLNLLPVGQLDGGHIVYALFQKHHYKVAQIATVMITCLALFWPGWIIWAIIITKLIGFKHPPTFFDHQTLSRFHWGLGISCIFLFMLLFMPVPVSVPEWDQNLQILWSTISRYILP
ncbi:site-2 protease family protein [candidate division CSSED10-310 bacterium]|uniref:Site-2 protease family protein n=1 Tax=candidate division CSSED10-310 bacterium TaxID=2855610 RepID=A0ABV6YZ89_UNCC1